LAKSFRSDVNSQPILALKTDKGIDANKTTILCTINYTMIKSIIMPCSWLTNLDNEMLHKRRARKRSGSRTEYVLFAAVNTCSKCE
jgi:hypothetical protein